MGRCLAALVLLFLALPSAPAQSTRGATAGQYKQETFLGLRFAAVPEVPYCQLEHLPRGTGVVVDQVKADSPAARAGLKRYDILLSLDGKNLKDAEQFARLVRVHPASSRAALIVLRAGKEKTLELNLAQVLRQAADEEAKHPRGVAKKGPPAVTVKATRVKDGKMHVTFEYSPGGKTQCVTFSGSLDEIETQVRANLPAEVQDLARVALDRLRSRKYR